MLSLVAVLLAATPGHASLLAPVETELRPSVRLLAQDSSQPPSEPPLPTYESPDDRIRELTLRIEELNQRIDDLQGVAAGPALVGFLGYFFAPSLLMGPIFLIIGSAYGSTELMIAGVGLIGLGIGAVAMIVHASKLKAQRRAELGRLSIERNDLTKELEALKRRQPPAARRWGPVPPPPTVTVLALSF